MNIRVSRQNRRLLLAKGQDCDGKREATYSNEKQYANIEHIILFAHKKCV